MTRLALKLIFTNCTNELLSYLVESVDLFPVRCESHESRVQVHQATNHKVLLADAGLLRAAKFSSPNHVAVTAFHTVDPK